MSPNPKSRPVEASRPEESGSDDRPRRPYPRRPNQHQHHEVDHEADERWRRKKTNDVVVAEDVPENHHHGQKKTKYDENDALRVEKIAVKRVWDRPVIIDVIMMISKQAASHFVAACRL